ncbi:hypothetical protein AB0F93_26335 [Micromonospora tulbaghiae]|uniref:hypothetical protein n=2 Tax=Micromonospora tulbaghiae TaxID=479978 RepID=UPI003319E727
MPAEAGTSTPPDKPAAQSRRPAEESVPAEPPGGDETPKRTRRAPAAKKAAPKKTAPAVKKATRKATLPKQAAPEAPAEPETAASGEEPAGTDGVTAEQPGPTPAKRVRATESAKTPTTTESSAAATATTVNPAAQPAASAAESAAGGQALSVGQSAADESRKIEPPALDRPEEEQPHDETETPPATVDVQHVARTPEKGWRAVGPQLRDHPGFAPELLALAAVDVLGPRARDWVDQVRRAYPEADADGVARLATRRFVRMAGTGGALAAGAGLFAPVAELAAVLWTQANLVLHLAAAYGRDPAHPDRAAELLVLTLVHPDDGTARAALASARAADAPAEGPWGRVAEAAWRLATPVAAQAGGWLGLRLAARLLPGAAALAAATGGTATAERVAARAVARYRPRRA